jgi:hypothetical protein
MAGSHIRDSLSGLHKPRRGNIVAKKTKAQGALVPTAGIGKPVATGEGGMASSQEPIVASTFTVYSSEGLFTFTFVPVN